MQPGTSSITSASAACFSRPSHSKKKAISYGQARQQAGWQISTHLRRGGSSRWTYTHLIIQPVWPFQQLYVLLSQ